LTAVEARSVSRAATQLLVSQPAISKTIKQIERAVGVQLVKRSSRGIEPTEQGLALLARSRAAFRELRAGIEAMGDVTHSQSGEVRIAGNQVALSGIIPTVINRLCGRHSGIEFNVIPSQTFEDQIRVLEKEKADLVVGRVALPRIADHLRVSELFRDDFLVVAGPDSRWRRRKKLTLAELVNEPWTFPSPDTVTGQYMIEIFRANGHEPPQINVIASSLQLHQRLVIESDFLTLFPSSLARSVPGMRVLPLTLKQDRRSIGILTLKYRTLSPLAKLFIDEAQAAIHDAGPDGLIV
jgi:DNA-binding transcriptional LysR family regulator